MHLGQKNFMLISLYIHTYVENVKLVWASCSSGTVYRCPKGRLVSSPLPPSKQKNDKNKKRRCFIAIFWLVSPKNKDIYSQ